MGEVQLVKQSQMDCCAVIVSIVFVSSGEVFFQEILTFLHTWVVNIKN